MLSAQSKHAGTCDGTAGAKAACTGCHACQCACMPQLLAPAAHLTNERLSSPPASPPMAYPGVSRATRPLRLISRSRSSSPPCRLGVQQGPAAGWDVRHSACPPLKAALLPLQRYHHHRLHHLLPPAQWQTGSAPRAASARRCSGLSSAWCGGWPPRTGRRRRRWRAPRRPGP